MNLADVMDQVAAELDTIADLRAFGFPVDSVAPPTAMVLYPEAYEYDQTYGRGMDRMDLPVLVVVGKVSDRSTRDLLGEYLDGSGARSIKEVVEAGAYTAFDTVRVMSVEIDVATIAGHDYLGALFTLDIAGKGS